MADAVNRGSEFLANLTVGTPWETVAKEVGNTIGADSRILRAEVSKDINLLVEVITSWMASNSGPKLLRPWWIGLLDQANIGDAREMLQEYNLYGILLYIL